ncbi:hypothetical protein [Pseudomonas sp. 2FE]|uniref:hypothetical protein n=1 Tax=Pseudomonas sp. 2FE TaxID=2502190 RepID=UPI0010F9CC8E|nr:hypothetical protein [Pseudomonas sp. 2FE]
MPAQKGMTLRQQEAHAQAQVIDWNAKHPIGTTVSFEEFKGRGETHRSKTRSEASVMCCEAVVWIEAQGSCVSLDHCTVVAESLPVTN